MLFSRRAFLNVSGATVFSVALNSHAQIIDPTSEPRKDERDVITQMANAGYKDFVLLNKKNSKLYLIQDSQFFLQTPVIIGRTEGKKNLTPNGVFSLTNVFKGESKRKMVFYVGDVLAYHIHGIVPGREYALEIDRTTARQLSDGCINVPDGVLPFVLGFARTKAHENANGQATPFVVMEDKYVPAKFAKLLTTFKPQAYNPD